MKKYVLTNIELYRIFCTRASQVKGGFGWLHQPNSDFPDNLSPNKAADTTDLPIKIFEESFRKRFGDIEPRITDYKISSAKKEAILELYPNAKITSFMEMHEPSVIWFFVDKLKKKICEPSMTSFGDNIFRPLWFSVLSDITCVFTFGILKPKRKPDEKCLGDLPNMKS